MLTVHLWPGRHAGAQYRDGWVTGTFAAAVASPAELRAVCHAAGVHRPSRTSRARATDDVVQIALAHPGQLLFVNLEATGKQDPHWRVLPPDQADQPDQRD